MKYYALSQVKEPGCPLGDINADLFDKYYPDTKNIHFGLFPWYAKIGTIEPPPPLPEGLVLISNDKSYDFDIRSVSKYFYVASEHFISTCKSLSVKLEDYKKIEIVSKTGLPISKNTYYAATFEKLDINLVADKTSQLIEDHGRVFRIKSINIKEELDYHLFKFSGLVGGSDTLICSQSFKDALNSRLKGAEFIPIENATWSTIKRI